MIALTPENTRDCRKKAAWCQYGNHLGYQVPMWTGRGFIEYLGAVKLRHDGRWDWWRKPTQYHEWKPGQGVAATEGAAKARVLEGWA